MAKVSLENSMYTTRFVTPDTVLASQRVTDTLWCAQATSFIQSIFVYCFRETALHDFWININKNAEIREEDM